VFATLMTW